MCRKILVSPFSPPHSEGGLGGGSLSVSSEEAQQVEEQVDEVEVEAQCAHQRNLLSCLTHVFLHQQHLLDLLRIIGRQSYEHQYADARDNQVHRRVVEEDVDDTGYDQANQCHEQQTTP